MKKKSVKEMVSADTYKTLKENNVKLVYDYNSESKKNKYSKQFNLKLFEGYDLLENFIVARPYIQKKYKIDLGLFEILLYLHGKKFFTQKDYSEMPKQFKYRSIKNLIKTGYVGIVQNGENLGKHVYRLNTNASIIIKEFYEVLSGEKKFLEDSGNPLARKKTRTAFDKKKMDLILKINQIPAPEKKKPLYQ